MTHVSQNERPMLEISWIDSPPVLRVGALAALYFHFAIVLFNVFWLIAVPLGAWVGWAFVRSFWWRVVHLLSLAIVAAQALAGQLCFLTLIQEYLSGRAGYAGPSSLLTRIVVRAIYWPLPDWVFPPLYALAFAYTAALWIMIPPARQHVRG